MNESDSFEVVLNTSGPDFQVLALQEFLQTKYSVSFFELENQIGITSRKIVVGPKL